MGISGISNKSNVKLVKMASKINKTVLDNGIRVLTNRMPHIRSISMGVWVNVGARDETPDENGLSHFIEHMIFKGTKRRTSYQIAKEFDAIGGHSNAFTSMENTCYHAKVMDTHLTTMVDILSDIFLNSVFDPKEFEKEHKNEDKKKWFYISGNIDCGCHPGYSCCYCYTAI